MKYKKNELKSSIFKRFPENERIIVAIIVLMSISVMLLVCLNIWTTDSINYTKGYNAGWDAKVDQKEIVKQSIEALADSTK